MQVGGLVRRVRRRPGGAFEKGRAHGGDRIPAELRAFLRRAERDLGLVEDAEEEDREHVRGRVVCGAARRALRKKGNLCILPGGARLSLSLSLAGLPLIEKEEFYLGAAWSRRRDA